MVAYPFPANGDAKTPPRQVTTNPPWPTPAASMSPPPVPMRPPVTPRSGKTPRNSGLSKSARASPYMTPNRVTISDGSPMVLFTPKQLVAQKEAQRRRASSGMCSPSPGSMGPPTQPRRDIRMRTPTPTPTRSRSSTPLFPPPQPRVRKVSTTVLAPAAVILGTPATERRLRDLARPPVELLQVLGRCVDDDWEKNVGWTLRDGLSNGRSEDRDVSRKWDPLCAAVSNFWPDILQWIMNHTPTVDKQDWFLWSKRKGGSDEYIDPQVIASKYSSLDRVGFNMSARAYKAGCVLIRALKRRGGDLMGVLDDRINPFFLIYACADCDVPLPVDFSRQLLWKLLDAIIRAECWRGLGSRRAIEGMLTAEEAPIPGVFSFEGEDPEDIVTRLLKNYLGSRRAPAPVDSVPVHQVHIATSEYQWVVKSPVGTFWYQAGDMDEKDIASFAVIDALTRLLAHCRGGILKIHTNDVRLLWGAYAEPSGAWTVVWAVCESYNVCLRAEWAELTKLDTRPPAPSLEKVGPIPQRHGAVVKMVVDKIRRLESRSAAYDCMTRHLTRVTG